MVESLFSMRPTSLPHSTSDGTWPNKGDDDCSQHFFDAPEVFLLRRTLFVRTPASLSQAGGICRDLLGS